MTKALTTTQDKQIAFSDKQIALIKSTIAKDATDEELQLFLYQASKTGLDPLARQIYFVKRAGQVTMQTSIDGFRIIAERSGLYAGQDEPFYEEGTDGKPTKCTISVYKFSKDGQRYKAAVGVAYWNEYCPSKGQDFMWNKMPHVMLAKVAESLALRKAFPQDLSGIYSRDEMEQAASEEKEMGQEKNMGEEELMTPKQQQMLRYQKERLQLTDDAVKEIARRAHVNDLARLSKVEATRMINIMMEWSGE